MCCHWIQRWGETSTWAFREPLPGTQKLSFSTLPLNGLTSYCILLSTPCFILPTLFCKLSWHQLYVSLFKLSKKVWLNYPFPTSKYGTTWFEFSGQTLIHQLWSWQWLIPATKMNLAAPWLGYSGFVTKAIKHLVWLVFSPLLWNHLKTSLSRLHFWWLAQFHTDQCHSAGGSTVVNIQELWIEDGRPGLRPSQQLLCLFLWPWTISLKLSKSKFPHL